MTAQACNCYAAKPAVAIRDDRTVKEIFSGRHEEWCTKNGGWECPHCDEPRYPDEAECPECKLPRAAADTYATAIDEWITCVTCRKPHPSVDPRFSYRCDACAERICNTDGYELHYAERAKLLAKILAAHQAAAAAT
jgi:hypothetical protein